MYSLSVSDLDFYWKNYLQQTNYDPITYKIRVLNHCLFFFTSDGNNGTRVQFKSKSDIT